VALHLLLSLAGGFVAWRGIETTQRQQAEANADAVGRLVLQYRLTDEVLAKMAELSGYDLRLLPTGTPPAPDSVQVPASDGLHVVEISYRAQQARASRAVILATVILVVTGVVAFGLVALWLAGQFARPLEALAQAARTIGAGDLERPVSPTGTGEAAALAADLEQMRQRLVDLDRQHRQAERLAAIGTFTATIAHEVRNPLTAVRLTVQMLAKAKGDDPSLRLITEELERLDLTVDQLLAYSKGMTVTPRACALRPIAEDVVRLLRRQADHAGVALSVEGEASVQADPDRLRQLLLNLVLNAIQAQHGGGAVAIALSPGGLSVADQGPGVDPALVPQLFDAFASRRPGGTGLGLHLAWTIAQAHGAELVYEQRERGARFVLRGLKPA
jgi:signal transduction histidine kinase